MYVPIIGEDTKTRSDRMSRAWRIMTPKEYAIGGPFFPSHRVRFIEEIPGDESSTACYVFLNCRERNSSETNGDCDENQRYR